MGHYLIIHDHCVAPTVRLLALTPAVSHQETREQLVQPYAAVLHHLVVNPMQQTPLEILLEGAANAG
jgi:hypothetical protein